MGLTLPQTVLFELLDTRVFQLVSQKDGIYPRAEIQEFIEGNILLLDVQRIYRLLGSLMDKFKYIDKLYKKTSCWESCDSTYGGSVEIIKNIIRRNILFFLIDLKRSLPEITYTGVIKQLGLFAEFLGSSPFDVELKKEILHFLLQQQENSAFYYIKRYFTMPDINELAEYIDIISKDTIFIEKTFDFIVQNIPTQLKRFPQEVEVQKGLQDVFKFSLFNLVSRRPTLATKRIDTFLESSGILQGILTNVLILSGEIPERRTGLLEVLINSLTSEKFRNLRPLLTDILIEILKSKGKKDSAEFLSIILEKMKFLNGIHKDTLKNLLISLSQVKSTDLPKWQPAMSLLLEKLEGFPIAEQKSYIESMLKSYDLKTVLSDFKKILTTYQNTRKVNVTDIRRLYGEFIEGLVQRIGYTPSNIKNNLKFLESQDILKETPSDRGDPHLEVSFSYALYGLLAHYDLFPHLVTDEISFSLFMEAIHWIYFLLRRYELNKTNI